MGSMYPVPTQSPTPVATRTPLPTRSPVPGTADTYIDKIIESNQISGGQIQAGENNINQISGCTFRNLGDTNKIYYIKTHADILFFDNVFINDQSPTQDVTGVLFHSYDGKLTITNCKFIRISSKGSNGFVINVNAGPSNELIIEKSEFIDCGKSGNDKPLIDKINENGFIKFYECNFTFTSSDFSFRVLESNNNNATFDGCRFTRCKEDTLKMGTGGPTSQGTFVFTNNIVTDNQGRFLKAENLLTKPVIENNIFEDTTLNNKYLILISHNQAEIELNNNTFSHITVSGNQNADCGGIAVSLLSTSSEYTIKYKQCKFNDITNNYETDLFWNGGAIQYGFSSTFNANIEITGCTFIGNKARRHGGAVAIRSSKSVIISGCEFESNIANNEGSSSRLLFDNHYNEKNKGFGGAIYLNPSFNSGNQDYFMSSVTISQCIFTTNKAYQGYGIYIEGDECQTSISINGNNQFINNDKTEAGSSGGGVIASEIISINIEDIERLNQFKNSDNSIKNIILVDHSGNPLPDPTQSPSPSQSPSQSPTETPSQSPSETPSQSPSQSPTETPSQSPSETPSQSPSQSPAETPSQSPTETPSQSPSQSPSETPSQSPTESPSQSPSQSPTETPSQSPAETPSQSPTETPQIPTDIIIINPDEDGKGNRIDMPNPDHSETQDIIQTIQVTATNFTDINNEDFGGAVHILNYGLDINDTVFTKCTSVKAGGGIYIKNEIKSINKDINLDGLAFNECEAVYGGAIYTYSDTLKSIVLIKLCNFSNNKASTDESQPMFGGSSIFLTVRKSKIIGCKMIDNEGIACKLFNSFDSSNNLRLLNYDAGSIIISNCKFTTSENGVKSSSLLNYFGGLNGVPIEIKECLFTGKLSTDSHYIDGRVINEKAHKLVVKKCQFDDSQVNSINLMNNRKSDKNSLNVDNQFNYISIDFNDQIFKSDQKENIGNAKSFNLLTLTAFCSVGVIVAGLIVLVLKKNHSSNDIEEESNEILNQNDL